MRQSLTTLDQVCTGRSRLVDEVRDALARTERLDRAIGDVLGVLGRELSLVRAVALFDPGDGLEAVTWGRDAEDRAGASEAEAYARAAHERWIRRLEGHRSAAELATEQHESRTVLPLVGDRQLVGVLQLEGRELPEQDVAVASAIARKAASVVLRHLQPRRELDRLVEQRDGSPVGQLTLSPDGDILELSDLAADLLVIDRRAVGKPLHVFLTPEDAPAWQSHLERTSGSGEQLRVPALEVTPSARRDRRLLLTTRRGRSAGQPVCFSAVLDVSARARDEQALRLLFATATAATGSLDPAEVLARLCRVLVPQLADLCVADVLAGGTRLERRVHVAHVDSERVRRFRATEERWGPLPNVAFATLETLREGRVARIPEVSVRYMQIATVDEDHLAATVGLALRSWLFIPLPDPTRRHPLAVLRLATAGTRRPFDDADVAVAEQIARIGGSALANAHAHMRLAAAAGARPLPHASF